MGKSRFSNYLSRSLTGVTQIEASGRMGLSQPVLNRLLQGEQQPNYDHIIKLAVFLKVHPAYLFELAGKEKDAQLCRALMPEEEDAASWPLYRRVQVLVRRGLARKVDEALSRVEFLWEAPRGAFEELVEGMGCDSACLVADHMVRGDVLYRWNCLEEQARQLAEKRRAKGWSRFGCSGAKVDLDLFILGGKANQAHIEISQRSWISSLQLALHLDAPS
ncbi:MAG: helix-turn-helix transcriptional regulator [Acidobacteriota bacterium]